jgi:hypothetical protein
MSKKDNPGTCDGCDYKIIVGDDGEEGVSCELGNDIEVAEDIGCESYSG